FVSSLRSWQEPIDTPVKWSYHFAILAMKWESGNVALKVQQQGTSVRERQRAALLAVERRHRHGGSSCGAFVRFGPAGSRLRYRGDHRYRAEAHGASRRRAGRDLRIQCYLDRADGRARTEGDLRLHPQHAD